MTPDIVFIWVAGLSFAVNAARLWQQQKQAYALWLGGLAGLCAILALFDVPGRGWAAGVLWAFYILLAQMMTRIEMRCWMRREWAKVQKIALFRCFLYPLKPSFIMLDFIALMRRIEQAPFDDFVISPHLDGEQQQMLWAWRLMVCGDFLGLVDKTDAITPLPQWLWMTRQRCLLELDRADQILQEYQRRDQSRFSAIDHALVRLGILVYGHQVAAVDDLLNGPLVDLHPTEKALWRLRCQIAGMENPAPLRQNLVDLLNKPATPIITKAIEREIARFPFRADLHSPAVQQKLSEWATKTFVAPAQKKPILSIGLIVLNVMMFLLTTGWNGELQMQAAYDMGIVVYPEMAQTGEWWRLITANFLHANWIHLLMNMLGILFIGVDLERHLGIWRYGLIYLASGIGTMAVGIVIYSWFDQGNDPFMALGASGAIFGLLGGFAVLSWHRWRHDHAEKGKQALKAVFLMIAIQSVFDFLYLEGSSTLHIAGFITGILVSLVVLPPAFRRRLFTDS